MADQYKYDLERSEKGEVEIKVTVDFTYFRDERDKVIKDLGKEVELKGFRKGQVPTEVLEGRFGVQANAHVVKQVAIKVVSEVIKSGEESVLSPLTIKEVSKYEVGKQVKFAFSFMGAPEVDLKKIKEVKIAKSDGGEVKDDEVNKVLEEMWKEDKARTQAEGTAAKETTLLGPDGKPIKKVAAKGETDEKYDEAVLSGDWAKKMDPSVSTLAEFKKKIKETLKARKTQYSEALHNHNLYTKVAEALGIKAPADLVEAEMVNREEEFYSTARLSGVSPAEYIRSQGISIEKLRENWKKQVQSGIEQLLVITGVAKAAGLKATDAEAEKAKGDEPEAHRKKETLEQAKMKVLGSKVNKYLEENVKTE